jgi:transcriptional regulator with XRE-family HTH domain
MGTGAAVNLLREFQGSRTQVEFAEMLGIDQSTLSLILAGKRGPNLAIIGLLRAFPAAAPRIAAALSAPAEEERVAV